MRPPEPQDIHAHRREPVGTWPTFVEDVLAGLAVSLARQAEKEAILSFTDRRGVHRFARAVRFERDHPASGFADAERVRIVNGAVDACWDLYDFRSRDAHGTATWLNDFVAWMETFPCPLCAELLPLLAPLRRRVQERCDAGGYVALAVHRALQADFDVCRAQRDELRGAMKASGVTGAAPADKPTAAAPTIPHAPSPRPDATGQHPPMRLDVIQGERESREREAADDARRQAAAAQARVATDALTTRVRESLEAVQAVQAEGGIFRTAAHYLQRVAAKMPDRAGRAATPDALRELWQREGLYTKGYPRGRKGADKLRREAEAFAAGLRNTGTVTESG